MKPLDYSNLCGMFGLLTHRSHGRSDDRLDSDDVKNLRSIERYLRGIELDKAANLANRILVEFEQENRPDDEFAERIRNLDERIRDDLEGFVFLYIPGNRADFYNSLSLFGDQVAANFPDANYDIEEAGKSFALDRHTACVMHLMRSLEVALDAVGTAVGLPSVVVEANNSWERLLRKIDDQIEANDKSSASANWLMRAQWTEKRQFLIDMKAHLFTVKNAWRNPSMHLEKKYTDAEAERIFRAVKDFMEHLATHLDQKGNFKP